ncbi:ParB N-terminal domain-containing protein [Neiella marina]|uniref:ParB N-terminal domain-containing protein n=1 Tax=Neiella holothuriorum TaxID=2870530 RepID=A0ABS7EGC1_9GAMM|nr:ParB N-terminal domain-containing protein [Neiella holothuriorum]MBW8191389.1 ParB N-terminal domain-containing protein [Neiella holothuriorum]
MTHNKSEPNKPTKPRKRRNVARASSQQQLINDLKDQSVPMGAKAEKLAASNSFTSKQDASHLDEPLFADKFSLEHIIVQRISPQEDNARFLPIATTLGDADKIAAATDCVVCDKGILENRLAKDHPRYAEVDAEIAEIISLSRSIKREGLIHPITVWRQTTSSYPILAGHRRYYAVLFLYGHLVSIRIKIYLKKPKRPQVIRFMENNLRQDTSFYDTLRSYEFAITELSPELPADLPPIERLKRVMEFLGVGKTTYYRLNKLLNYKSILEPLLAANVGNQTELYNKVIELEKTAPNEVDAQLTQWVNDVLSGAVDISVEAPEQETPSSRPAPKKAKRTSGRVRKHYSIPKLPVSNPEPIKQLVSRGFASIDCGVDWDALDYGDVTKVQEALEVAIQKLVEQSKDKNSM